MLPTFLRRLHRSNPKRGNSLLESLFAGVLLSVGLVSLVYSLQTSYNLVQVSRNQTQALNMAHSVISTLKAHKRYDTLYEDFSVYDDQGVDRRFYVLEDGTLDWSQPMSIPEKAVAEGYLTFVINEYQYPASEWGTDTAFTTNGVVQPGKIDLDGDFAVEDKDITVGRTLGTPLEQRNGYYVVLPVKVTVRMYRGGAGGSDLIVTRRGWVTNNLEHR